MSSRPRRIALIVGNGFDLDYLQHLRGTARAVPYDTQNPLGWSPALGDSGPVWDDPQFAGLQAAIEIQRSDDPSSNDFDIIDKIMLGAFDMRRARNCVPDVNGWSDAEFHRWTVYAMRQYLVAAFVQYHQYIKTTTDLSWPWAQWLKATGREIAMIISFNYDLLVEIFLASIGISFRYIKGWNDLLGIQGVVPLFKPHGSINCRLEAFNVYSVRQIVEMNDVAIREIGEGELQELHGRNLVPDLILPGEYSYVSSYQYVRPGYTLFRSVARSCTHCVFLGLSYWTCDREELDQLMADLPKNCEFVIANPFPSDDLRRRAGRQFQRVWLAKRGGIYP